MSINKSTPTCNHIGLTIGLHGDPIKLWPRATNIHQTYVWRTNKFLAANNYWISRERYLFCLQSRYLHHFVAFRS